MEKTATPLTLLSVRDRAQDISKGLGILMVASFHLMHFPDWYQVILAVTNVWLMTYFFVLSGNFYTPGKRTPRENIKRRAKQLIKPFFQYSIGLWILTTAYNLITRSYTLWECVKDYFTFLVSRNTLVILGLAEKTPTFTPAPGILFSFAAIPFWFLVMMFLSYIIFYLVADYALFSTRRFLSVAGGLVLVTYALNLIVDYIGVGLPWNIQNVPMGAALLLIGALYGKHSLLTPFNPKRRWKLINSLAALGIIILMQVKYPGMGSFAAGHFSNFGAVETFACVLLGTLGTFMFVCFCRLLDRIPVVNRVLEWFGLRTLPILLVHIPVGKFVTALLGVKSGRSASFLESFCCFLITVAIIVIYRIVWEWLLKRIQKKA